jgi:hypothetical protein
MNCDMCGEIVSYKEDATILEALVYKRPITIFLAAARHIRCSPSRAQYIVHENFDAIIDQRAAYDKRCLPAHMREAGETLWTKAWEKLQDDEEMF